MSVPEGAGPLPEKGEAGEVRGQMTRVAAALWATAGLIAWVSIILPRPEGYRPLGVAAAGAVGMIAAAGTLLGRRHITPRMNFVLLLTGAQVITAGCFFVGLQGSPFVAMLYVWLGAYAFYFFRRLAVVAVVVIGIDYAALLVLQPGNNFPLTRWLFVMTTVVVTSALVSYLVDSALRSARAERAARMEAERAKAELQVVSRHKSDFLANMSHELRTPLNAIIGFSDVLKEKMFGELNARQEEYIDDIRSSGRHLLALINEILDLSKVEAGRMELDVSTFPVAETIREGTAMVRNAANRRGITLEVNLDPELGAIEADQRKLKQVLFNLLSNAVKFTPSGGRIEVAGHRRAQGIEVQVIDTGIGIPHGEQEKIFEEFHQVDQRPHEAGRTTREGTGLGLALARRFVELHGGRIGVESCPGAGSTFSFTLPLRQPSLADAEAAPRG
jgi:signal transduction histidine kinase